MTLEFRIINKSKRKCWSEKTCLSLSGNWNPSSDQTKCGGGVPTATHLSDTAWPGCIVCSENTYSISGVAAIHKSPPFLSRTAAAAPTPPRDEVVPITIHHTKTPLISHPARARATTTRSSGPP